MPMVAEFHQVKIDFSTKGLDAPGAAGRPIL
jgi:hypothetical protein